jgi:hypothetical protein
VREEEAAARAFWKGLASCGTPVSEWHACHSFSVLCNKILIIGLPLYSLHVLQPLDLVIFGPFKVALCNEAYAYEIETGQSVDKDAALLVIGRAFMKAFTRNNILAAFQWARIWPLDGDAIDLSATAPSESTSVLADAPVPMLIVIKQVVQAFNNITPLWAPKFIESLELSSQCNSLDCDEHGSPAAALQQLSPSLSAARVQRYAIATWDSLISTSYEHIVSVLLARSSDPPPPMTIQTQLAIQKPDFTVLQVEPNYTDFTHACLIDVIMKLWLELDLSHLHINEMEHIVQIYQAKLVLSGAHSWKQQRQLHGHEERAQKKKNKAWVKIDTLKGCCKVPTHRPLGTHVCCCLFSLHSFKRQSTDYSIYRRPTRLST